ncbi:MAG TPA: aldo/keto reductase, partial [Gemmatimonadales bacterium]|nr:aldo/keto reductase [Gemmatimonadales bacterium]
MTRPLGPGAGTVPAVGYGGMHLSIQDRPPEADALRVLAAVLEAGATLIDTADAYCLDEREAG